MAGSARLAAPARAGCADHGASADPGGSTDPAARAAGADPAARADPAERDARRTLARRLVPPRIGPGHSYGERSEGRRLEAGACTEDSGGDGVSRRARRAELSL
jgi:hypothetical protein